MNYADTLLESAPTTGRDAAGRAAGLRICSLITSLTSGGAERLVTDLSCAFSRSGARSTVVSLCDAPTLGNSSETEAQMRARIIQAGGAVRSMGLNRARGIAKGALALRRIDREFAPDIWHLHTARAAQMALLAGIRAPVVLTHHNSRLTFPPIMFRLFDRVVDEYVAISPATHEIYRQHAERPCRLILNGVRREFAAQTPKTAGWSRPSILSVGAVSEQKNYGLLVDVAIALRAMMPAGKVPVFSIAGGGERLDDMRARVSELGLENDIRFLGERSDVGALMSGSDLFLNTSLYEGMSIAMIEAMSKAMPIVATRVPGNVDLVSDGENGLLAPVGDAGAIASALQAILNEEEVYRRMSQRSLEMSRRFSLETAVDGHISLYRSILASRRSGEGLGARAGIATT